jgi:uncharacterized membrane protein (UPF0127 family)
MKVINWTRDTVLVERLQIADTFFKRLKGLLGSRGLPSGEALLIRPCNAIHMFGMRFALDIVFVSRENVVLQTVRALQPAKTAKYSQAAYVLELSCGTLDVTGTEPGDVLEMVEDS